MAGHDEQLLHTWATTTWPKIFQGRGDSDEATTARRELVVRYHEMVYHYFQKKLRDPHAAQELYSNFALRLPSCIFFARPPMYVSSLSISPFIFSNVPVIMANRTR